MTTLADVIVSDDPQTATTGNPEASDEATTTTVTISADGTNTENKAESGGRGSADDADIPEKFRGKSAKDIAEAYQNLERQLGRMANDLGQQRALTDRILQLDQKRMADLRANTPPEEPQAPKVTTDDILSRPQEVLEKVTDARTRSAVKPLTDRLAQLEAALAQARFETKHPDYVDIANDPAFAQWVQGSPMRTRIATLANQGNWQAADDLFTEFKQYRREVAKQPSNPTTSRSNGNSTESAMKDVRRSTLESRGAATESVDEVSKGERFSRAKLMRMRIERPEEYFDDAFQARVLAAYNEGRVTD